MRTSRAALAACPLDWILPSSQARAASARVLKNRAAQSHLSIRTEGMLCFATQGLAFRFKPTKRERSADSSIGATESEACLVPVRLSVLRTEAARLRSYRRRF